MMRVPDDEHRAALVTGLSVEERMRILGWDSRTPMLDQLKSALGVEEVLADLDLPPGSGHYEAWREGVL